MLKSWPSDFLTAQKSKECVFGITYWKMLKPPDLFILN